MARTQGRRNRGGAAEGGNQWRAEMCNLWVVRVDAGSGEEFGGEVKMWLRARALKGIYPSFYVVRLENISVLRSFIIHQSRQNIQNLFPGCV